MTRRCASERGLTLLELLLAILLFGIVMAGALSALRSQTRGLAVGTERLALLQNAQFAVSVLQRDLRTMGTGVLKQQPFLVYAGPSAVAFNTNHTTNIQNDIFAVFYNPDAPAGSVSALTKAQQITLPGTGVAYPDTDYVAGGVNSPAETITLFFTPDSSTTRTDDYALFRQVNGQSARLVARSLLPEPGVPFLRYHRLYAASGAPPYLDTVPPSQLPLRHTRPIHLAPDDTGTLARVDSVRAVRVSFVTTNGLEGPLEQRRSHTRVIRLPNAGLAQQRTCGEPPILGVLLSATLVTVGGQPAVRLSWNRATDEAAGEDDVIRYVLWRRDQGAGPWGDPYLSIPAGKPTYVYVDAAVTPGSSYQYALAAQDCTPSLSDQTTSPTVGPIP